MPTPTPELYSPGVVVATVAYSRPGLLGATAISICERFSGSPLRSGRQCSPPSVDLYRPPAVPLYTLLSSHGPERAFHRDAYTMFASLGSILTPKPPVFSSRWSTALHVRPPS